MKYFGLLTLGVFIGSIISIAVNKNTNWSNIHSYIWSIIGSALSGAVFSFIQYLGGLTLGDALFMYPIGLLVGLMWVMNSNAVENLKSGNKLIKVFAVLQIVGVFIFSIIVLMILFLPGFKDILPKE